MYYVNRKHYSTFVHEQEKRQTNLASFCTQSNTDYFSCRLFRCLVWIHEFRPKLKLNGVGGNLFYDGFPSIFLIWSYHKPHKEQQNHEQR